MPRLTDNGYPQWMTPLMPQDVAPEMRRSCWQACLVSGCAFVLAQPWIGRLLPQGQIPLFLSGIAKLLSLFTLSSSTALLWVMLGCLFWLQFNEAPFPIQILSMLGRILSYFILGPAALALLVCLTLSWWIAQPLLLTLAVPTVLWGLAAIFRRGWINTERLFSVLANGALKWRLCLWFFVAGVYSVYQIARLFAG